MAVSDRCPPAQARRIASAFSNSCRQHLGEGASSVHPRDVDRIWRLSGGHLGKITSGIERVVSEAASLGYHRVGLFTVVYRWEA